jgi:hypothetical protein
LPNPQTDIDQFAIPFKFAQQYTGESPAILQETIERIYINKVGLILRVFIGVGEDDLANNLRQYAVECIPDAELRDRIMQRLYSSPSRGIQ